jgi:hypothetical protein
MKEFLLGLSAHRDLDPAVFRLVDYVEVKKITEDEVRHFMEVSGRPVYLHLQYSSDDGYLLPAAGSLLPFLHDISRAFLIGNPGCVSMHFGPASEKISLDHDTYIAVAEGRLLSREEIVRNLGENLALLKRSLPGVRLLIENVEYIPENLSGGSYRYVQENDFFSQHVRGWKKQGILDGIIFDVAHGLIAAANHPLYNGSAGMKTTGAAAGIRYDQTRPGLIGLFDAYISGMPLDLVEEVHVSGIHRMPGGVWVDAHREIGGLELDALARVLERVPERKISITLEYVRSSAKVEAQVGMLAGALKQASKTVGGGG